jgi:hypothetical protein
MLKYNIITFVFFTKYSTVRRALASTSASRHGLTEGQCDKPGEAFCPRGRCATADCIIGMTRSGITTWVRHVADMGEMRNGDISVGRREGKRIFESSGHGWKKL